MKTYNNDINKVLNERKNGYNTNLEIPNQNIKHKEDNLSEKKRISQKIKRYFSPAEKIRMFKLNKKLNETETNINKNQKLFNLNDNNTEVENNIKGIKIVKKDNYRIIKENKILNKQRDYQKSISKNKNINKRLNTNKLNNDNIIIIENLDFKELISLNLKDNNFTKYELLLSIGDNKNGSFKKLEILDISFNIFRINHKNKKKNNKWKNLDEIVNELNILNFKNIKLLSATNGVFTQKTAEKIIPALNLASII